MDLTYDELYEIKYCLKYSIKEEDDEDTKKKQINALKKIMFKMAIFEKEKELLKKDPYELNKNVFKDINDIINL
jgi:enolase